jgi:RimJ/RimL family protein N-acetyltransferase
MRSIDLFCELRVEIDGGACELRPIEFGRFGELVDLVGSGLFPDGPSTLAGWYEPDDLVRSARRAVAYHASTLADASAEQWALPLGVWVDGTLVGVQGLDAEQFRTRREASTGSFLAPHWRGRGLGKLARQGILAAAFDELEAQWVVSSAMVGNAASRAVSLAVGYEPDGLEVIESDGTAQVMERFRISRAAWRSRQVPSPRVTTQGFEDFRRRIGLS